QDYTHHNGSTVAAQPLRSTRGRTPPKRLRSLVKLDFQPGALAESRDRAVDLVFRDVRAAAASAGELGRGRSSRELGDDPRTRGECSNSGSWRSGAQPRPWRPRPARSRPHERRDPFATDLPLMTPRSQMT